MKELIVEIKNEQGLHTRPVKLIVQTVRKYSSKLHVRRIDSTSADTECVSGDDLLGLLSLAVLKGEKLLLAANGKDEKDEEEMLKELFNLIEIKKFGEE